MCENAVKRRGCHGPPVKEKKEMEPFDGIRSPKGESLSPAPGCALFESASREISHSHVLFFFLHKRFRSRIKRRHNQTLL